jgi:NAD(P)-dependent dehydrogenase (short-subunit alcohol dehydrogenase family)
MRLINRFARMLSRLKKRRENVRTSGSSTDLSADRKLLEGLTVLVTGGAGTVGQGVAIESARQGANVIIVDIDDEAREKLERDLAPYAGWVKSYNCDLSRSDAIDRLCASLENEKILVDVLVNNVGVQHETRSTVDLDIDEWQETFATNVFGPMYLTRCIARSMIDNNCQGSILFITSIHQWIIRRYASYSASKGALGMIIKELAVDLAPHGIRVNGIAPGWVAEDATGKPLLQRVAPLHQSSIRPCYIGRAAVYLSANHYSFHTTGSVLKIDAGLSLSNYLVRAGGR